MSVHWTIEVPDDVAERVASAAAERGVTPEAVIVEVLIGMHPTVRELGIVGLGHSGRGDLSRRVKETRRKAFVNKTAREA